MTNSTILSHAGTSTSDHTAATTVPGTSQPFDITAHYTGLLANSPTLTAPLAAILSLLASLTAHPASTAAELLQHLSAQAALLQRTVTAASGRNALPVLAGTDLLTRYILSSIEGQQQQQQQQVAGGADTDTSGNDFAVLRARLLAGSAEHFIDVAKTVRGLVAQVGSSLVSGVERGVLTVGGSRTVQAVLLAAAAQEKKRNGGGGAVRWRVVYVLPDSDDDDDEPSQKEGELLAQELREADIPTATARMGQVFHLMGTRVVDVVLVGAEALVANGGAVSRMGTSLVACAAKDRGLPVYVAAESHKFVRKFPKNTYEVPVNQDVVKFEVVEDGQTVTVDEQVAYGQGGQASITKMSEFVDYMHPKYISGIITENGVIQPSAVNYELTKMWS